jgi:hypothetical protein
MKQTNSILLAFLFLVVISCKQKKAEASDPVKTIVNKQSNTNIVEEQYIQDDSLTDKFFSELDTFKRDSRFVIKKELSSG